MADASEETRDERKDESISGEIDRLARRLENSGITEYVKLSMNTRRILWLNFLSGISRGLGFTIGTAFVLGVVFKILSGIIDMNIPYLTELLTEFVRMVKEIK